MLLLLSVAAFAAPEPPPACLRALARGPAAMHALDAASVRRVATALGLTVVHDLSDLTHVPLYLQLSSSDGQRRVSVTVDEVPFSSTRGCRVGRSGAWLIVGDRALEVSATRGKRDRPDRRRGLEAFGYVLDEVLGSLPEPVAQLALTVDAEEVVPWSVAQPSDVLYRGVDGLELRHGDAIVGGDPHGELRVLYDVMPGQVHAVAADHALSLELVVLGRPEGTPLADGASSTLPLSVPDGDPRPAAAHASLTVEEPSVVTLVAEADRSDLSHPEQPRFPAITVVGPSGPVSPRVLYSPSDDGAARTTVNLAPGDYHVRLTDQTASSRRAFCEPIPFGPSETPAWCDTPADPSPWSVKLTRTDEPLPADAALDSDGEAAQPLDDAWSRGVHPVDVPALPAPDTRTVEVERGLDVLYVPSPVDADVSFRWASDDGASARGGCVEKLCRFPRATFDALELSLWPRPDTYAEATVDVFAFPPPEPAAELEPGYVVEGLTLERLDLRGPLAEVALHIPGAGTWKVSCAWPEGADPVQLEIVDGTSPWGFVPLNLFNADRLEATWFSTEEAGTFTVRVSSCPTCAEQAVDLDLQAHAP